MSEDDQSRLARELRSRVEACLTKFGEGTLVEEDLKAMAQLAGRLGAQATAGRGRQSLLYMQATTVHPYSGVIGMSIYEEGKDPEGVDAEGKFLYPTVRAALDDGWRIIKFPETALMMDDQNTYGLGYEFILERWR